jgi:ABC-2 type transport system ATP-binding protein
MNVIECNNLTKLYGNVCALNGLTFSVPDCDGIVGLLGPNGAGKTTLIKILTGLLRETSGEMRIMGKEIGVETKAIVSYLSDMHALDDSFTVQKQINFYEDFFLDFDRTKAEKMLLELGIALDRKIKTLSKGTKEKLSLVLTLSRNAKLFVLDEPIAGVDPAARDYVLRTILSYKTKNSTVLLSTHLISEIEQYFDYVLFLQDGKIVLEGKTEEIRERENCSIDELFRRIFKWI